MSFVTPLISEHIEGKWRKLHKPLIYYSERLDKTIIAPKGFVSDFASVPRLPLAFLICGDTQQYEAVIHDLLYRWGFVSRFEADMIFHEASVSRGRARENQSVTHRLGRWARRNLMTGAVVSLGWTAYDVKPGCLDYRKCLKNCSECQHYYRDWSKCFRSGYHDNF